MALFIHAEVISQEAFLCLIEQPLCMRHQQQADRSRPAALHIHQNLSFNDDVDATARYFLVLVFQFREPIQNPNLCKVNQQVCLYSAICKQFLVLPP